MRLVANTLRGAGLLASSVGLLLIACDDNSSDSADAGEHAHAHDEEGGAGGKAGAGGKGADGGDSDAGHGGKGGTGGAIDSGGAGGKGGAGGASDMGGSGGAGGKAATGGKGAAAGAGGAGGAGGADAADTLEVKIQFKAMVGDKDFACNTNYEGQGKGSASTITPQDMRLFIQDLALIKEDGSKAAVTFEDRAPWQSGTVALLDFEDNKGGCVEGTKETNTELTGTVAKGTYKGISFVNGVPENLNHADPTMFPEPLKTSANLSWNWLTGFRFSKIEVVNTKPGETDLGRAFFHPGSTACTGNPMQGTVKCGKSNRSEIVFEEFDADMDTVIIDVAALFKNTDLEVGSECHSTPAEICTPMFDAWGLNFSNGGTKSGQTVFRKE